MSVQINLDMFVRIEQLEGSFAPLPKPLDNGFSKDYAYKVQGITDYSESSETFLILVNNDNQIWFISNRHLRYVGLKPNSLESRIPLGEF